MEKATGVLIALQQEAFSIFGKGGWVFSEGLYSKAERIGEKLFWVVISGKGPERAQAATKYLLACNSTTIINMGVAGALVTGLEAGDVLCPTIIKSESDSLDVSALQPYDMATILGPSGVKLRSGHLLTVTEIAHTPAEKKVLHDKYSAHAVDMEAYYVGAECVKEGVPFYAIKAISDTVNDTLPAPVTGCVDELGRLQPLKLAITILLRPWLIPKLLELQSSFNKAIYSLELVRSAVSLHLSG